MSFTKQYTLILAIVALVGLLAGCGTQSSETSTPITNHSTTKTSTTPQTNTTEKATSSVTQKTASNKQSLSQQGQLNSSLQSLMKIDSNTLQKDVNSGKSLADIAKTKGVSEQQLIDVFENNLKQTLDKNVSSGKLTKAKEDQLLANAQSTFKEIVEQKSGN